MTAEILKSPVRACGRGFELVFQDESGLAILSFINSHSAQDIPLCTTP